MSKLCFNNVTYSTKNWSGLYNLELESGRCYVVCGPSGSGKSTFVHLAAGFLAPKTGDIQLNGDSLTTLPPHKRHLSFMSQADGLFPGVSIMENLSLALHDSLLSDSQKKKNIIDTVLSLDLETSILERLPSEISGGQLSRCNLARAVLRPCQWLFLDEPFAAVDRPTRIQILGWLRRWMNERKTTITLIAHDLDDIFTIATDIIVIDEGKVVEIAKLSDAIARPKSSMCARILRSGLIIFDRSRKFFIASENLFTSKKDADHIPQDFLSSHTFQSPQVTQIGRSMRVVDLIDANDITLPFASDFSNTVWFDQRMASPLEN